MCCNPSPSMYWKIKKLHRNCDTYQTSFRLTTSASDNSIALRLNRRCLLPLPIVFRFRWRWRSLPTVLVFLPLLGPFSLAYLYLSWRSRRPSISTSHHSSPKYLSPFFVPYRKRKRAIRDHVCGNWPGKPWGTSLHSTNALFVVASNVRMYCVNIALELLKICGGGSRGLGTW